MSGDNDMAKAETLGEYFSFVVTGDNGVSPQTSRKMWSSYGPGLIPALLLQKLPGSLSVPFSLLFS
jgi:hypothetical protein